MIQKGERIENQQLKLGVFTQDLAQELDKDARAVDLVTDYARTGSDGDITITDEDARRVMGALGLTGEKSLRQIKALSGGEKARVALSMFSLKASNLLMLDEPSNHLVSFVYSNVSMPLIFLLLLTKTRFFPSSRSCVYRM